VSHHVLQALVVRLLYDPELVARMYADPERALAGLELTAAERKLAIAPDRRAYATDPHRRSRTLTELLREYPVAASFVAGEAGGIALLDRFFSSPNFHAAIADRMSLARTFGDYLLALARKSHRDPRLAPCARLEQAIAGVRRTPVPSARAGKAARAHTRPSWLVRPPGVQILAVPAGTLEQFEQAKAALGAHGTDPVAALLSDRWRPPLPASPTSEPEEHLLVEADWPEMPRSAAEGACEPCIRVGAITPELAALLTAATPPGASPAALAARARELGADPGEEAEILGGLVAQGLLVAGLRR
jgi:hypothetical protein